MAGKSKAGRPRQLKGSKDPVTMSFKVANDAARDRIHTAAGSTGADSVSDWIRGLVFDAVIEIEQGVGAPESANSET